MSLPPAQKDISEHPAKGSVSVPVDKVQKEADVGRKLRFYGVLEAFRKGRLPTNDQIDRTLRYVLDHSPVDLDKLSPGGQKLIHDTRDIIETARLIVREKNGDELLQTFVWHTFDVDLETIGKSDAGQPGPVDRDKARSDAQQAVQHLRTLLRIVLTNSEARKLFSDFSVVGRDLLSKTAVKAAETIAPPKDVLDRVNESAPPDQFITQENRPEETSLPRTNQAANEPGATNPALGIKTGLDADLRSAGQPQVQDPLSQGTRGDIAPETRQPVNGVETAETLGQESSTKRSGLVGKMKDIRDNITDRIPSQHKETAQNGYERGRRFLTEEYFPEERRDQFIYRGKKMIIECQKHDDYQASIRWLLGYIEEYAKHGRTTATSGANTAQGVTSDKHVDLAIRELRTLLERFANGTSLDIIIDAANVLIDDSRRDPELRDWFKHVDAYIRKVLLEAGYVLEPDCNTQGKHLRETGRKFYDDKYRGHFDNLFNSVSTWFKAMGEDPLNKRFGEDWARLTRDLLFDSEGSLKFKPELWGDIRKVILPQIIDKVGYIPIPRIEYTDESLDLVVENLTLQGRNLFPNIISMEAHNFVKFSPYNAIRDDSRHRITLTFEQMQADMRDVAFYYHKKSGIPKMKDSGLADVLLGGEGLSATVVLHSTTRDKSSVFTVESVHVKVDTLKFSIRDSKHDFLYKTLKPLATGLVKRQIQKAIRDALTTGLEYVDGQLVAVRDRMASAKETEGESRINALKTMFQRKDAGSIKSSERGSHFKIVNNKRNSIVAEGHPAGWVNRAEEKEKEATRGAEWRSDAFNIIN